MRTGYSKGFTAALVLLLATTATPLRAQGPPGPPPGGMMGGLGGPGGPGGPGGGSLLFLEPIQKDIELTDKQKAQLKKLQSTMMQKSREGFQAAREEGLDPQEIRESMMALGRDFNTAVNKVPDKNQKAPIAQIELQREGLLAVAKSDVASKLKLTAAQTKKIKTIVDEMRKTQFQSMPQFPMPNGNGGFGGPGGPGAGGPPADANADVVAPKAKGATKKARGGNRANNDQANNNGDNPAGNNGDMPLGEGGFRGGPPTGGGFPGGGGPPVDGFFGAFPGGPGGPGGPGAGGPPAGMPDFNSPEFKAFFTKMRDVQKKTRKAATDKIAEVLTKEQASAFDKMLGKPFDLTQLEPPEPKQPAEGAKPADDDTPKADAAMPKPDTADPAAAKGKMRKRGGQ